MAGVEKYVCSNKGCDHIDYSDGICPECGGEMTRPKGDDYKFDPKMEDDSGSVMPLETDDDPSDVIWYTPEGGGEYGMM